MKRQGLFRALALNDWEVNSYRLRASGGGLFLGPFLGPLFGGIAGRTPLALRAGGTRERSQPDVTQSAVGMTTPRALRVSDPSRVNHAVTPRMRSLWVSVSHKKALSKASCPPCPCGLSVPSAAVRGPGGSSAAAGTALLHRAARTASCPRCGPDRRQVPVSGPRVWSRYVVPLCGPAMWSRRAVLMAGHDATVQHQAARQPRDVFRRRCARGR